MNYNIKLNNITIAAMEVGKALEEKLHISSEQMVIDVELVTIVE